MADAARRRTSRASARGVSRTRRRRLFPTKVAVVGAGQSAFGARGLSAPQLFFEAFVACVDSVDRGATALEVEEAYIGSVGFGGAQLGNTAAQLTESCGLAGIGVRRVENACASSGFAFRDAFHAIASGAADLVVAGGVERMNDLSAEHQRFWLGVSGDTLWERLAGATFPGIYALMANRHMHEFGTTKEALAACAVKNHRFGAANPKAQFQKAITLQQALEAPMVAAPLNVYDCCSTTDGASAVLLASARLARKLTDTPIWVGGSGAGSDLLALHDRPTITSLLATKVAAQGAFRKTGLRPRDLDVAEVHDCFTIAEVLAIEDLGLARKGEGGPAILSGATDREGEVAVNLSGGLKAKGHPLGATGTGQVAEVFAQLRGQVPKARRRSDAQVGLTHNVGGSGATCAVHLLWR